VAVAEALRAWWVRVGEEEEEEEEQQQQVVLVLVVEAKRSRSRLRLLASGCAWERKRVDVSVGCSSGLGFRV